jgi:LPPG:FO 2-phospho-L-lactate transferase
MTNRDRLHVAALAGGVGGAKLAHGLAQVLLPDRLTVIVNSGDDFEHLGLKICPDLDTVCYTLAGFANPETGWGRIDETWNALESLEALGGPAWFRLGDRDLGTHLERTRLLLMGWTLSQITEEFSRAWDIEQSIMPVSDDVVPTIVDTDEGILPFQEYFVKNQCRPKVKGFRFNNVDKSRPAPGVLKAIGEAELVVFCPSNPWVSIDPILAIPGVREELLSVNVPIIAVSPIIGGESVKGPAAKMYSEMGFQPSALVVAEHYGSRLRGGLLTGFVMDEVDKNLSIEIQSRGIVTLETNTIMETNSDRRRLAKEVLEFGKELINQN